jgi:leader peptidase (prepilin peptidase)/N-methyltransferase
MLALVALFMANLIGTVVVMVGFAAKKLKRGQHVPFGPFFITGAVVAQLFGSAVVQWYLSSVLG